MSDFSNVVIGRKSKKYTHDLSYDCNTSMGFGTVQPVFSQFMSPGDHLALNCRELVRLAPMPAPTFARISVVNAARFVPMCDIYPAFDAFVSHLPISSTDSHSYTPNSLPYIKQSALCLMLLKDATFSIGHNVVDKGVTSFVPYTNSLAAVDLNTSLGLWLLQHAGIVDSKASWRSDYHVLFPDNPLSTDEFFFGMTRDISLKSYGAADLVLRRNSLSFIPGTSPAENVVLIKFGVRGRMLYDILKGLGYSCDFSDRTEVCFLPILAYYKAWFDLYMPTRDINWHSTPAYSLINDIYLKGNPDLLGFLGTHDYSTSYSLVKNFLSLLYDCYYTTSVDWYAAHTQNPLNVDSNVFLPVEPIPNGTVGDNIAPTSYGNLPRFDVTNNDSFSLITLQVLRKLTRFLRKNSIVSGKVEEYVRAHYGSAVADDMFGSSYNIGSYTVNCDINDVYSTSDTYTLAPDSSSSGTQLGAYAGKGLGFTNGSLKYDSREFGYALILTSVVPKSGYACGDDSSLISHTRYDFYNPEFDALGYNLTPRSVMYDNEGLLTDTTPDNSSKSFGYIPSMSNLKHKKDILNGDFSRMSTRASLAAYHLEHDLSPARINDPISGDITTFSIPDASTAWRYPSKYSWLGNFDRIFYNGGLTLPHYDTVGFNQLYEVHDDNFLIQCVFDVKLSNSLKSMSQSYDTVDDDDNNTTTVNID